MVKGKYNYIYGNEIGMILGVNENKSIKKLYSEKIITSCESREEIQKRYEEIYWDNTIKEILCKEFTIRSGKKVRKELKIIVDEEYDFMHCKVDRRIVSENSILLCCTYSGNSPSEEINENTFLECQHNMRVTKANKCYVACLINNKRFIFKEIYRDEKIISKIIKEEKAFFYNHILKEISPV